MIRVGTAPVSWGVFAADDPLNLPWTRFLDEAAACGYGAVELGPFGYVPPDPEVAAPALALHSLAVSGGFVYDDLHDPASAARVLEEAERCCALLEALGARVLVLIDAMCKERMGTAGSSRAAARLDRAGRKELRERVAALAGIAAAHGLQAAFHPHVGTHVEFDDEIRELMAESDATSVGLCVDTGHCAYAGVDPVELIERYGERVWHVHLKDVDPGVRDRIAPERLDFDAALEAAIFCPLGQGMVDFDAVIGALVANRYDGWATVEMDIETHRSASAPRAARASLAFLVERGIAEPSAP